MKQFVELYYHIDQTPKVSFKEAALVEYFQSAAAPDKVWAIALLSQKRPKRIVTTAQLKKWCLDITGHHDWIFEESHKIVGDLTETIAYLLPTNETKSNKSVAEWIRENETINVKDEEQIKSLVLSAWKSLSNSERYIYNKLITGTFRTDLPFKTLVNALAIATNQVADKITHRLSKNWDPFTITFKELVLTSDSTEDLNKPFPFHSINELNQNIVKIGAHTNWQAERKWNGIRGQLILRQGYYFLWTHHEDLISSKIPELAHLASKANQCLVIEGTILPYKEGQPLPINLLQSRINRKTFTKKHLADVPVHIIASDLLEYDGNDIRHLPVTKRRRLLEEIVTEINDERLLLSPIIKFDSWEKLSKERDDSRKHFSEGIILKKKDSPYNSDQSSKDWWMWKVDLMTVNAVLLYAQRGQGGRSKLYTEFTFAVWEGTALVPFTKAYSELSDKVLKEVSKWIKSNIRERFGPVASLKPELVFELGFEDVAVSSRHKSGIVLRSTKIKKWQKDVPAAEADTLQSLKKLVERGE